MIKLLILALLVVCCMADPIQQGGKCSLVKNTMLTCFDSTVGDLPQAENKEIEWLVFTRSKVPVLKKKHLENFPALTDLHLKETQLASIEDDAFEGSRALSWVDVSCNELTTINPKLFHMNPEIYFFNISHNPNLVIPKNQPFINAPKLKWLLMQNSNIKQLYSETFQNVKGLKFLSLSDNLLTEIPGDLFKPLVSLTSLDLSRNNFKTINIESPSFRTIALYLNGNPWDCDCKLFPAIEWAKTQRIKDDVACSTPDNKKWKDIGAMNCPKVGAR